MSHIINPLKFPYALLFFPSINMHPAFVKIEKKKKKIKVIIIVTRDTCVAGNVFFSDISYFEQSVIADSVTHNDKSNIPLVKME
jgi:hypothetical protein